MNDKGEIHARFPRTFRLTQAAIDGLLSVAEVRGLNATAALEACIAQADAALRERERLKLSILAAHCWRMGALPPHRFSALLDMIAGDATAAALRNERRALIPLARADAGDVPDTCANKPAAAPDLANMTRRASTSESASLRVLAASDKEA